MTLQRCNHFGDYLYCWTKMNGFILYTSFWRFFIRLEDQIRITDKEFHAVSNKEKQTQGETMRRETSSCNLWRSSDSYCLLSSRFVLINSLAISTSNYTADFLLIFKHICSLLALYSGCSLCCPDLEIIGDICKGFGAHTTLTIHGTFTRAACLCTGRGGGNAYWSGAGNSTGWPVWGQEGQLDSMGIPFG